MPRSQKNLDEQLLKELLDNSVIAEINGKKLQGSIRDSRMETKERYTVVEDAIAPGKIQYTKFVDYKPKDSPENAGYYFVSKNGEGSRDFIRLDSKKLNEIKLEKIEAWQI